jgi:hypothetical protein
VKPRNLPPARNGLREFWECRAGGHSAKANVGIEVLDIDVELPGVGEDGMSGRNVQRKLGTTRGSPRRSRTAKALRISRYAVKSRAPVMQELFCVKARGRLRSCVRPFCAVTYGPLALMDSAGRGLISWSGFKSP